MREQEVYRLQAANAKRAALLLGQFEFLQTRQEAMERVERKSNLWDRLKRMWNPEFYWVVVDAVQKNLLEARQKRWEQVSQKPDIKIVPSL